MVAILPFDKIQVPVPGFGAMGLTSYMGYDLSFEEAEPVLSKAIELGCTFWDSAVAYGAGANERLLGEFIKKHNLRDKVFVASKCGFEVFGETRTVTNSAAHIKQYIEGTIERLGFAPDLYYLHRIDPIAKIDAIQAEYSAFETLHETNGLIDTAKELGVAFIAFSPLGHGWLVDDFPYKTPDDFAPDDFRQTVPKFQGDNFYKNKAIVEAIKSLAAKKGCTIAQIALAWVAAQGMIAIPGTTKPKRLEENWASRNIELTEAECQEMRAVVDKNKPHGVRFAPFFGAMAGH